MTPTASANYPGAQIAFGMGGDLPSSPPASRPALPNLELKQRRTAGIDTFLLRDPVHGTFSIAREWTDQADLSPYDSLELPRRRFDADSLFELATLLEQLTKPEQKG